MNALRRKARAAGSLDQIAHFDGWNLEHRIKSLITNLHAPDRSGWSRTLSGGEKRRVALCRALLCAAGFSHSRRADESSRYRLDRMARGFSRALFRHLFVRDARSLFPRSHRDAGGRAVAREILQLRRELHRLLACARRTASGRGDAGAQTPEIFETRAGMGAQGAARAADKISRPGRALFRNGGARGRRRRSSTSISSFRRRRSWPIA